MTSTTGRPNGPTSTDLYADETFRLLVNAVTDYAIYMLDPSGHVVNWNAGAERLKGYSAEEVIGRHFSVFYSAEDLSAGLPLSVLETVRTAGKSDLEGWRMRKNGSKFWAHDVIHPVYDAAGQMIGFATITRDLSERRSAKESLQDSREEFGCFVEGVTDYAIFKLDPGGKVVSWNAGAQRIKGYAPSEIIGHHFSQLYIEEDRAAGEPERALAIADREGRFESEGWRLRKDGRRFWANVVIDPIRHPDGRLRGFVKITRDNTERRENQQNLELAREALFQLQKMEAVGQLTAGMAHEFNNRLFVVLANTEALLEEEVLSTGAIKYLGEITKAAQGASDLTRQLLAFSRKQPLRPQRTNLNDLVIKTAKLLHHALGSGIEIESVLSDDLYIVEVDPSQLETALVNLCINARDAMPNGGRLLIETRNVTLADEYVAENPEATVGSYVLLCVTDNGTGMPPDTLARVFEPFFTTKEVGKGTGLGLSMVYGFIKQSNGHIKVHSEVGRGTSFKLYLPYSIKKQADVAIVRAATLPRETERILLVEDDPSIRGTVIQQLRSLGYIASEAPDASAGLAAFERAVQPFDLLLTDMVMPGALTGKMLADEVQARWPGTKVVFMSGYSEDAIIHHGGPDDGVLFLSKPFRKKDLARIIRQALDGASDPDDG